MATAIQIDEVFGIKQDALVEGYTRFLQDILLSKQLSWSARSNVDFFRSHPNKKWSPEEEAKINHGDIRQWDTTLCAKWLMEFIWEPFESKLSKDERAAVDSLRHLRNSSKHRAQAIHLTEDQFLTNCYNIQHPLLILGIPQDQINEILTHAEGAAIVDKNKLMSQIDNIMDTTWSFESKSTLGCGSFGVVMSVKDKVDHADYAIKIIPYRKILGNFAEFEKYVTREPQILAQLNHENVFKYYTAHLFQLSPGKLKQILMWDTHKSISLIAEEFFSAAFHEAEASRKVLGLYIQTEVCGETLRQWLNQHHTQSLTPILQSSVILRNTMCKSLVDGINYIHSRKVIHRDLRPDNIFFAKSDYAFPIKIGDFGLSNQTQIYQAVTMTKGIGNLEYRAPEINQSSPHKPQKAQYSQAADLYSLGLVISEIFDPVSEMEIREKFSQIKYAQNTGLIIKKKFPFVNDLILRLTDGNPDKRQERGINNNKLPVKWYNLIKETKLPSSLKPVLVANQFNSKSRLQTASNITNYPQMTQNLSNIDGPSTSSEIDEISAGFSNLMRPRSNTHLNTYLNVTSPWDTNTGSTIQLGGPAPLERRYARPDAGSLTTGNRTGRLVYSDILKLRKLLQKNKSFWKPNNLSKFFGLLEGRSFSPQIFEGNTRTMVNSNLYRIHRERSDLMTKSNIMSSIRTTGFLELSSEVENLSFQ